MNSSINQSRTQSSNLSLASFDLTAYALNATYIIIGVFGIVGNFLALLIICTHRPLRKRLSNYYFINQIVVDFLVCSLMIPSIVPNYGYTNLLFCLFWQSRVFFLALYLTSTYSILAMAVERYMEIVHPIKHRLAVTKKKVYLTIIATWAVGFVQKIPHMMASSRPVNGVCILSYWFPNLAASTAAGLINWIIEYLIPISVITFCYVQMLRTLRGKVHPLQTGSSAAPDQSAPNSSMSRARKNIFVTLVIIVVCFVLCNTLKQTLLLVKYTGIYPVPITSLIFNISQILAFVNATIEPYVYLLQHREFKTGFRKLIGWKTSQSHASEDKESHMMTSHAVTDARRSKEHKGNE